MPTALVSQKAPSPAGGAAPEPATAAPPGASGPAAGPACGRPAASARGPPRAGDRRAAPAKPGGRRPAADPFGLLKALAAGPASAAGGAALLPSIASLLAAATSSASSDVTLVGYTSLAEAMARPAPEAESAKPDDAEEQCPECGGRMHLLEHEKRCASCQFVVEGDSTVADPADDDAPAHRQPQTGRLRIVGPNSGHFQPDLDRSSNTNYAATQRKQVYEELVTYRQRHVEAGGVAFPFNVLELTADLFHEVQKLYTKRSQSKKAIMAACLQLACILKGFAPNRTEVTRFVQLQTKGTARGDNFIRKMKADGQLSVDVNKDTCMPHIRTTFALLDLDTPEYAPLQKVADRIVKTSIAEAIGISSVTRSKAMGASYVVLRRHAKATGGKAISLAEFCQKCAIRKNTCDRFVGPLNEYHSYFEGIYKDAGLYSGPLEL